METSCWVDILLGVLDVPCMLDPPSMLCVQRALVTAEAVGTLETKDTSVRERPWWEAAPIVGSVEVVKS